MFELDLFLVGVIVTFVLSLTIFILAIHNKIKNIQDDLKKLNTLAGTSTLLSPMYLTVLTRQWRFWEKLSIQRMDKFLISNKIVSDYLSFNEKIIIDSGTTVDQIPQLLNEKYMKAKALLEGNVPPPPEIFTNNLLAAISVMPPEINVCLLSGIVDKKYGATYHPKIKTPLKNIRAAKIVLAATTISFVDGPMVSDEDRSNKLFKAALVEKATEPGQCVLIIAVDWTKFKNNPQGMGCVLDPSTWNAIRATNRFYLIITQPDRTNQSLEADEARNIINRFRQNENQGGMKVIFCN